MVIMKVDLKPMGIFEALACTTAKSAIEIKPGKFPDKACSLLYAQGKHGLWYCAAAIRWHLSMLLAFSDSGKTFQTISNYRASCPTVVNPDLVRQCSVYFATDAILSKEPVSGYLLNAMDYGAVVGRGDLGAAISPEKVLLKDKELMAKLLSFHMHPQRTGVSSFFAGAASSFGNNVLIDLQNPQQHLDFVQNLNFSLFSQEKLRTAMGLTAEAIPEIEDAGEVGETNPTLDEGRISFIDDKLSKVFTVLTEISETSVQEGARSLEHALTTLADGEGEGPPASLVSMISCLPEQLASQKDEGSARTHEVAESGTLVNDSGVPIHCGGKSEQYGKLAVAGADPTQFTLRRKVEGGVITRPDGARINATIATVKHDGKDYCVDVSLLEFGNRLNYLVTQENGNDESGKYVAIVEHGGRRYGFDLARFENAVGSMPIAQLVAKYSRGSVDPTIHNEATETVSKQTIQTLDGRSEHPLSEIFSEHASLSFKGQLVQDEGSVDSETVFTTVSLAGPSGEREMAVVKHADKTCYVPLHIMEQYRDPKKLATKAIMSKHGMFVPNPDQEVRWMMCGDGRVICTKIAIPGDFGETSCDVTTVLHDNVHCCIGLPTFENCGIVAEPGTEAPASGDLKGRIRRRQVAIVPFNGKQHKTELGTFESFSRQPVLFLIEEYGKRVREISSRFDPTKFEEASQETGKIKRMEERLATIEIDDIARQFGISTLRMSEHSQEGGGDVQEGEDVEPVLESQSVKGVSGQTITFLEEKSPRGLGGGEERQVALVRFEGALCEVDLDVFKRLARSVHDNVLQYTSLVLRGSFSVGQTDRWRKEASVFNYRNVTAAELKSQAVLCPPSWACILETKGPDFRTAMLKDHGPIELIADQEIIVEAMRHKYCGALEGYKSETETRICLSYARICQSVSEGGLFLLADGAVTMEAFHVINARELGRRALSTKELGERRMCNLPAGNPGPTRAEINQGVANAIVDATFPEKAVSTMTVICRNADQLVSEFLRNSTPKPKADAEAVASAAVTTAMEIKVAT
ncbi:hypothetical protein BSKO_10126 [Bryopsis sp. KO-2023]|nr:hypothetical protein BSKO_10126 [Bryopsis sp. KO-2023]